LSMLLLGASDTITGIIGGGDGVMISRHLFALLRTNPSLHLSQ